MTTPIPEWAPLATSTARTEEILVTVKAYPNPSRKYIETVCVAGITRSGQWIRLYPIPYRSLKYEDRFPTYAWIRAVVRKAKDHRPESYNVELDSLSVLSTIDTRDGWKERRELLLPHVSRSIEDLKEQQDAKHTSLGMIRPKEVKRLIVQKEAAKWPPDDLAKLRQRALLAGYQDDGTYDSVKELEKIPYRFMYEFTCNDPRCGGHRMSVISWEVMQSYRSWRQQYGDQWEPKFRQKYELELPDSRHDLHFFLGTISSHPKEWTIIGLFYPPAMTGQAAKPIRKISAIQPSLFS